ncbi:DUF5667 domain-containing protein [Paenibacillus thermotolerans]|uniref:DUF5667 domain-containing protein n=1 Tax=Paenibacillus thermotolerans TaxID=3027807 RepID=UPI0023679457|nr:MULTISPECIES: DUF5667 domain-containing protein [unclassified Paenibacillus]
MKKMVVSAFLSGLLITAAGAAPVLADDSENTNQTIEATAAAGTDSQIEQKTPALIPGNFFYFIKTVVENIQLALTFNDVDKALLLAEHAQERILEANALIAEGKSDLAAETLQKALENQQKALQQANQTETLTSNEDALDAYLPAASSDDVADEEDADEDLDADEDADHDAYVDEDEDKDEDEHEDEDADSKVREQFSGKLKQNIASLILAMNKVKNPTAKAALAKNIEKSFGKMVTKSAKFAAVEEVEIDDPLQQLSVEADEQTDVQTDVQTEAAAAAAAVIMAAGQSAKTQIVANTEVEPETKSIKLEKKLEKKKEKAEKQHGKPEKSEKHNNGRKNGHNK